MAVTMAHTHFAPKIHHQKILGYNNQSAQICHNFSFSVVTLQYCETQLEDKQKDTIIFEHHLSYSEQYWNIETENGLKHAPVIQIYYTC